MDKPKVVHWKNLPSRPPITFTVMLYLLLKDLEATGWVWGAVIAIVTISWIATIVGIINQQMVNLFPKGKQDE